MSNKFVCFNCERKFNLDSREPIILICCGKTACRDCVNTKMIKNKEHAKLGVIKKGEFECSNCHSECYVKENVNEPLSI
jgi:hypothetical protein